MSPLILHTIHIVICSEIAQIRISISTKYILHLAKPKLMQYYTSTIKKNIYIYACYMHEYRYIYIYIIVATYTFIYACIYVCIYMFFFSNMCVHLFYKYLYTVACMYRYMYIYTYIHVLFLFFSSLNMITITM